MLGRESHDLHASDIFAAPGTCESEPLEALLGSLVQGSPGKQGSPASQAAVKEIRVSVDHLFNELEDLAHKHQVERSQCLARWLQHQGSVFAGLGPESSGQRGKAHHKTESSHVYGHTAIFKNPRQLAQAGNQAKPLADHAEVTSREGSPSKGRAAKHGQQLAEPVDDVSTCPSKQSMEATDIVPVSEPSDDITLPPQIQKSVTQKSITKDKSKKRPKKKKNGFVLTSAAVTLQKNRLQACTSSRAYEMGSAALIALNSVTIGWQVQWSAEHARDIAVQGSKREGDLFFDVLSVLFTLAFTVELGLRWVADGFFEFFRTEEFGWCVFDVFIVSIGLIELAMRGVFHDGMPLAGEITLLRILRIMRIVKVLRVIRVMRFFRELRMMIWSIAGSIKSLMWVMLVLALLFYIFGILITQGVETFLTDNNGWDKLEHKDLVDSFATLDRAMLALFMSMSGGNDWSLYYFSLMPIPMWYRIMYLVFIVFSIFAVVNIVTGVFVQSAMNSSNQDREIVVHEELESKRQYCEAMREFFEEVDEDGSGMIGYTEFVGKLDDDRVLAYFNALKLDVSDADTLFKLLDYDHSGEVDIDEFLVGCHKLQGESRNLDMKVMQLEVKQIQDGIYQLKCLLEELGGPRFHNPPQSPTHLFKVGWGEESTL